MTSNEFVGLVGAPAAIAAIASWLMEFFEPFHALTPFGKKLAFLTGCMALAWLAAGVGTWLGYFVLDREMAVKACLSGAAAFYASQVSHLPATGRR